MLKLNDDGPIEETTRIDECVKVSRLRLVVMSDQGNVSYPLPPDGELVIGRTATCDVRIDDVKLSRKHAILRVGRTIELVDLGSTNGTKVANRALFPHQPVTVSPGEVLTFGSTMAVIQAAPSEQIRHLRSHAHFEARLAFECKRAVAQRTGFAIARIGFGEGRADVVEATLEKWLRATDVVAERSPQEWEFLLADATAAEAAELVGRARLLLAKSFDMTRVEISIATFPASGQTPDELMTALLRKRPVEPGSGVAIPSGFLERTRPLIERVASGTISVLVTGETGAGKEVLAHMIHRSSPRAKAPILCLNCAALSETLLESELFGYERGAFTGAAHSKPGLIESADGGTVFLDEIGEMPPSLQAKLLRVIQEKQVQRIGSLKPKSVDVRFVSATNRDLVAEVARGAFRQDLLYRLNGVVILVPPLRERRDEVEPLARAFVMQCAEALGVPGPSLAPEVLAYLQTHAWPGNIRELRNVIERAVLLCTSDTITLEHVIAEPAAKSLMATMSLAAPQSARGSAMSSATIAPGSAPGSSGEDQTPRNLPGVDERARIIAALESCGGNQTQAAKLLGIARNTLIARLDSFDIARPRKRGE